MRKNTAWAFAGNTVYAGCQWAVFVLLVKALKAEEAGAFAYATAVTGPVFVLSSVRLRNLLATAVEPSGGFADYLTARLLTTAAAVAVSLGIGLVGLPHVGFSVLAVMTAGRACDAVSDLCHGLFQREMDMRSPAIGLAINGVLSVALVALALMLSSSLVLATAAYALGSFGALSAWDLPKAMRVRRLASRHSRVNPAFVRRRLASAWRLIVTALPLGLSSAIGNVQTNVPRYVIASVLGPAMLARFAAISYITMAGHLIVNATSQAALPVLAKDARTSDAKYKTRLGGLVAGTLALGAMTLFAAYLLGRPALAFIYGPEYAGDAGVLVWLVAATVVTFGSVFLGTGTTARHRFGSQLFISTMSLVVVAACTPPLVSGYGLHGAAWALVAGAVAEFSAYTALTFRDLRGAATAVPGVVADAFAGGARQ